MYREVWIRRVILANVSLLVTTLSLPLLWYLSDNRDFGQLQIVGTDYIAETPVECNTAFPGTCLTAMCRLFQRLNVSTLLLTTKQEHPKCSEGPPSVIVVTSSGCLAFTVLGLLLSTWAYWTRNTLSDRGAFFLYLYTGFLYCGYVALLGMFTIETILAHHWVMFPALIISLTQLTGIPDIFLVDPDSWTTPESVLLH